MIMRLFKRIIINKKDKKSICEEYQQKNNIRDVA